MLETYLGPRELAEVYNAYLFSAEAHDGQKRRSGEPYISHPLEVARILAEMHLDAKSITAAILHDVIEDTRVAKPQITAQFGADVAELVDGVSKIDQIEFQTAEEEQAENFRKMLLAMTQDIRVILIKLADRLHNMRTLGRCRRRSAGASRARPRDLRAHRQPPGRVSLVARARGPGFHRPLSRALPHPVRAMRRRHGNRKAIIEKVRLAILDRLGAEGVSAEVKGRERNIYSVYRKMRQKSLPFDKIYDVYAFRIIVDRVDACYRLLGVIHNLYKPIPGRFMDYIAIPKANGYQSLHTSGVRPVRPVARGADSHRGHAPRGRGPRRRTGCTRAPSRAPTRCSSAALAAGPASRPSNRPATRTNSSSISRSTCSRTRFTCSRPRATSASRRAARA